MKIRSWIPFSVDIDEEEPLALKVRKTVPQLEAAELKAEWRKLLNAEAGPARDVLWNVLLVRAFDGFIRFAEPTAIKHDDGTETELSKPSDLVAVLGMHPTALDEIFLAVLRQTGMTPEEKKAWRSAIGSMRSSGAREKEVPGEKQPTTATSAESGASADSEGASSPAPAPSGSTEETKTDDPPSSSTSAQSSP